MKDKGWTLAGYRAFNDELARRLEAAKMGKERPSLETFVRRGREGQRAIDDLVGHGSPKILDHRAMQEFGPSDAQLSALFSRRLHQVAAKVRVMPSAEREAMCRTAADLVTELHELAAEIEERLGR